MKRRRREILRRKERMRRRRKILNKTVGMNSKGRLWEGAGRWISDEVVVVLVGLEGKILRVQGPNL